LKSHRSKAGILLFPADESSISKRLNMNSSIITAMRRHAYPYARYLVRDKDIDKMGLKLRDFMAILGLSVIKYNTKNEGNGTLIISVNKKIMSLMKQKKPPGRIQSLLSKCPINLHSIRDMVFSEFTHNMLSFREMDCESQRVGVEIYLWPMKKETLLEIFILPYMERLNRPEIFGLTQSKDEEFTDWYLSVRIWDVMIPEIEGEFDLKLIHMRA